jgi:hypothetical protein
MPATVTCRIDQIESLPLSRRNRPRDLDVGATWSRFRVTGHHSVTPVVGSAAAPTRASLTAAIVPCTSTQRRLPECAAMRPWPRKVCAILFAS